MGLDMYLRGEQYNSPYHEEIPQPKLDGKYAISDYKVDLGYWRKHADLHGYIVDEFADGKDDCQQINLTQKNLEDIIDAIRNDNLKLDHSGFFFGNSTEIGYYDEKEKNYAISCFEKAIEFLKEGFEMKEKHELYIEPRGVYYRASW